MATFVSRASWGARPRRSSNTNITPQNGGVSIHHVDAVRVARTNHADCAAHVQGIQNFHMDTNQWADIAYSHLTCVHGYVFEGRGEGQRTAANGTDAGNQNWYGVCGLVGGTAGNYDPITNELIDAFHLAITRLRNEGNAASAINGHRDHLATACPGELYALVQDGRLDPGGSRTHTVQEGDTLFSIGQQYGVPWESIAAANGISDPYTIYVGQVLVIPAS